MSKEATQHAEKATREEAAEGKHERAPATLDSMLPPGSWQRVAAGVAAAAGGGLIAAAAVGVGPAALAGAAGYLAYRSLNGERKNDRASAHKS